MHHVLYEEGSNGKTNKINSVAHVWWFCLKPSECSDMFLDNLHFLTSKFNFYYNNLTNNFFKNLK